MKIKTKTQNFTIPKDVIEELNEYSKESMIPMSKIVTKLLREFLKNNKDV